MKTPTPKISFPISRLSILLVVLILATILIIFGVNYYFKKPKTIPAPVLQKEKTEIEKQLEELEKLRQSAPKLSEQELKKQQEELEKLRKQAPQFSEKEIQQQLEELEKLRKGQ